MIELEWTFGYENRTPTANDRAKAMLAGDVTACPADFQEAWLLQVRNPNRNYAAPLFRKYNVKLSELRKDLQADLFRIDPAVKPPIPLYDEDEKPERFDPVTCGSRDAILKAVTKLRAKLNGIDPSKALQWQQSVKKVMLAFTLNYVETIVCMNVAGIPRSEVEAMFKGIDTKECPPDFIKAWEHDLPYFFRAEFGSRELQIPPVCKRYGVDESVLLDYVKGKMGEWNLRTPTKATQPEFRLEFKHMRANILDHR